MKTKISAFSIANPKIIMIADLEGFLSTIDLILIGTGEKNILLNQDLIIICKILIKD